MSGRSDPLTNSQGQVTQAVFVFTNMLRKLLADEKPHYIAAVFESAEKTFRHETFESYKANRAEMPDELVSQLPYIIRVCEAFNIPIIDSPGFEADDCIGTLAHQCAERGIQAVVVSNDKDMCQLVQDPLIVCMRQNSQNVKRKVAVPPIEWCNEAWVENKFGLPPRQIIDLLGLMGDAVDNIPGAPGIGEKGAVQLIKQFGSIENALERWEEVKHKTYRESLQKNVDLIRQSRELATIRLDVPIELDLDRLRSRPPDRAAAYQLFRELEFQTLTREFADAATPIVNTQPASGDRKYRIIRKRSELDALVRNLWDIDHWAFAVTPGSTGLPAEQPSASDLADAGRFTGPGGIAISTASSVAAFIDLEGFEDSRESAIAPLQDVLTNGLLSKSVHDLKQAMAPLAAINIEPEGISDDTMIAAYLLDPIRTKYEIADLAPFFVEDPVRTEAFLQDLPILRKKVNVPLAAGEEWGNRWDFNKLVEDHDIDFVRATLPNVGGITEMMKIAAICETHFVGIAPHFTGPIATAALVNSLGTFSAPVLMEYNYQGRTLPHVPVCLDFKNGKLYPNDRPGLGVELDFRQLTQIAEITEPVTARAQTYFRSDGSITNW